jgi:restriction system protein
MKQYKRIMLGAKSIYADACYEGSFIGADFGIVQDLSAHLPDNWRAFNEVFRPIWMETYPEKSKIAAGLACGMLWSISKGLNKGDVVLCPDGQGRYYIGTVRSNYYYKEGEFLPHRRKVKWSPVIIDRAEMSYELQKSTGSIGTASDVTQYAPEIEQLLNYKKPPTIISTDEVIEDPSIFALEKHLEAFLVQNWKHTDLGKVYDIYEEEGELVGQQFLSDTGPMDILAVSKDKKALLVVELKKGRASDVVVGQIQRYMGYVKEELAESHQEVKGVIIALEDDLRLRRALSVTQHIEFYKYEVSFRLIKS